jgi:hypothetical protein
LHVGGDGVIGRGVDIPARLRFARRHLYATAGTAPDLAVERKPERERRFMTDVPTAHTGPRDDGTRSQMRELIREADARYARNG